MIKNNKEKLIIGLTGSFCSGKSTVAKLFKAQGGYIIDADKIYHELIRPEGLLYKKLISLFGKSVVKSNGQLMRKLISERAFNDKKLLRQLTKLTHPVILKVLKEQVRAFKKDKKARFALIDAPLLIESGLDKTVDRIIIVKTSKKIIIQRCKKARTLSSLEIKKRISAQMPYIKKCRLADFVINNSGRLTHTKAQVKNIVNFLTKN